MRRTFMDLAVAGEAWLSEVDEHVDAWHTGDSSLTLADYLGMTDDEYQRWVQSPGTLAAIVAARRLTGPRP
jgi:hypothetical protein